MAFGEGRWQPWQGVPVDLLFHVGGVAAAVVGEQQPPVVEAVHVDLDVRVVHDDHVGGQRLAGHLRAGDTLSVTPKHTGQQGWRLGGTSPCSVQRLLPWDGMCWEGRRHNLRLYPGAVQLCPELV